MEARDEDLLRMAREWYGYGWWEAPFWFIGPEPGRPEKEDTLNKRCAAWIALGAGELVDCKSHHFGFAWMKWHRNSPAPPTQPTWRQLIRLLLAFCKGQAPDLGDIRGYQQCRWGMRKKRAEEETCVVELCSLAAPNLTAKKNVAFDSNCFLKDRINVFRSRVDKYKPRLVLMYGQSHAHQFREIAGCELESGKPQKVGATYFVHTPAPTSRGLSNEYWLQLAEELRRAGLLCP
jgi:hypothetical protein